MIGCNKMMTVAVVLAATGLLAGNVQAAELFVGRHAGTDRLGLVDPAGPTGTAIGDPGVTINALAYDAVSDTLWGTTGASSATGLHVLDQNTGAIISTVDIAMKWVTALTWDTGLDTLWGVGGRSNKPDHRRRVGRRQRDAARGRVGLRQRDIVGIG